jgi:hypothetical protein
MYRKLMISNCKLYRINKRTSIYPVVAAKKLWKKDADIVIPIIVAKLPGPALFI